MNTEPKNSEAAAPVTAPATSQRLVIAPRGALSTTAVRAMRSRGIEVAFVKDPASLKEFGNDRFKLVSDRAKVKAFEYALTQEDAKLHKANLNHWYIHFLKQEGAF